MKKLISIRKYFFVLFAVLFACQHVYSQNTASSIKKITDGLYIIDRFGCNIAVSVGSDGVLIIDSGYSIKTDNIKSAINEVSTEPIKFILNTHFHFDHVGGNNKLSNNNAVIVAHNNTRTHMMVEWNPTEILGTKWPKISPYSKTALPEICFSDSLTIVFNEDTIKCLHYPNGHSDCDAVYLFRRGNVIHAGDLFLSNGFPLVDNSSGGTINGYLDAIGKIISRCDDKTIIIPGHGPISNRNQLKEYLNMLTLAKDRIAKLIEQGKALDEIVAADPVSGLYKVGKSWLHPKLFIYTTYMDLIK